MAPYLNDARYCLLPSCKKSEILMTDFRENVQKPNFLPHNPANPTLTVDNYLYFSLWRSGSNSLDPLISNLLHVVFVALTLPFKSAGRGLC